MKVLITSVFLFLFSFAFVNVTAFAEVVDVFMADGTVSSVSLDANIEGLILDDLFAVTHVEVAVDNQGNAEILFVTDTVFFESREAFQSIDFTTEVLPHVAVFYGNQLEDQLQRSGLRQGTRSGFLDMFDTRWKSRLWFIWCL
ncbi:MAG: hypothetical protein FWG63_00615 [Defluviitaleaceae bacterium]|nr:hypothetical protein [Defluviitaleaceae bacterium]